MNEIKNVLEKGTVLLDNLNFNILFDDENVINNPFSLIHPGFLYYIWGKLLNSNEKFQEASALFNKQIQKSLDSQNYADAGEFAILRLKTEGHLEPQSNNLKKSYKKAKIIYENLINLYNDAYYIASLIEVEVFYEKYSGNKINREKMEELYRKVSFQYYLEAESIIAKDLISIRIMDYFEAVNHLNKITFTLTEIDKIQMETITNKMISEILIQIDGLDKRELDMEDYSKNNMKINLEFGLGKAYSLINRKTESKLFYGRALRRLDKTINENKYILSLLRSRNTLYKEEDYYKIQNIKIFSKSMFEQIIILNEKIELFDLRIRILSAVEDLEKSDRMEAKKKVYEKIIELNLGLIKMFEKELENEKIERSIKEKYSAFIVYLIYQVYKLFKKSKTKTSLKK